MMKTFLLTIAVLVAVQGVLGKPKGKQPVQPAGKSALEELSDNTRALVKNVTSFLENNDLPDTKKIVDAFNETSQKVSTHVDSFIDFLKTEWKGHQGDVDKTLKKIEANLKEASTSLQNAVGPEATAKANEIKAKWDVNLKKTVAQVDELRKAVEPDVTEARQNIENAAKAFLNKISDASKSFETQLKATVNEHQATHKH